MNKYLLIFLFGITCSYTQPKYCKLSDKIVSSYTKQLQKEKGLILIGKGGAMKYDVKQIILHYVSFEKMDVSQARRLYIEIMEEYLKRYNQDEKIRPYLHNFPFAIENIELRLTFKDETKERQSDGFVAFIFIGKNNQIVFDTYDHEKKDFCNLCKEPYEKALEIVNGLQRAAIP